VEPPQSGVTKRTLILLVAILVAGLILFLAGKATLADHRSHSRTPANWLRAAELEPGNGDYWERLGMFREFDFDNSDPYLAIQYYRKALESNPRSDLYWMNLASTYEIVGDTAHAREAYQRARAVYPISAEVAWNYGNFLLRQSQFDQGFAEIHRAVTTDPSLIPLAISRCWRSTRDVNRLLSELLPTEFDAYFQTLDFLAKSQESDAAQVVWKHILALQKPFPLSRSFPYVGYLVQQDQVDEAKTVWAQAIAASGWPYATAPDNSVIWNGGFEYEIANGGFDWYIDPTILLGASIGIDTTVFHSGKRSLRVEFTGSSNVDFHHVSQWVAVKPMTHYHFRAYMRTEQISTESGPRFLIYDPQHPNDLEAHTDDLTGTQPWTPLEVDLTTSPRTHFLLIQLRRIPSRLFDNKLSGTVWVDDVSLTPAPEAPVQTSQ
jgi:tetratricopeptide (TPR) repeat protein